MRRVAAFATLLAMLTVAAGSGGAVSAPRTASARVANATPPSRKAGVASSLYLATDPKLIRRLGASWAYDWKAVPPRRTRGLGWVPMVWGANSVTGRVIATLRAARRHHRAYNLLGFNEPDSPSQSNMSPAEAAALWPRLERTGLNLGSPAPADPTGRWLPRFMALARARHLRVNFIALHYYQDFTYPGAVSTLRRDLIKIYHKYHLPIWITELGAVDLSWKRMTHTPTDARASGYMRKVFAMLNGLPFVQRYAWFTDDCWNNESWRFGSLFDASRHLTDAGKAFKASVASVR